MPGSYIFFLGSYSGSCQFSWQYPGQDHVIKCQDPRFSLQDPTQEPINFPGSILVRTLLLNARILDFLYRILLRILSLFLQYPGQEPVIKCQDPRFSLQDSTQDPFLCNHFMFGMSELGINCQQKKWYVHQNPTNMSKLKIMYWIVHLTETIY